jgi:hypothetical protein
MLRAIAHEGVAVKTSNIRKGLLQWRLRWWGNKR